MNLFLYGVIFAMALTAAMFFFSFWRKTKDPLFIFFALAFALLGVERLAMVFSPWESEYKLYLIRLVAFILIIVAIIQKNRGKRG